MNLAKNGAVLLAALSVFATTSCGGGTKTKELTFEEAVTWIKENFPTKSADRTVESENTSWNYSGNKGNGEKLPQPGWINLEKVAGVKFVGKNINEFTATALTFMFEIPEAKAKETKGNEKNIESLEPIQESWLEHSWTEDRFKKNFDDSDEYEFYATGKELKVVDKQDEISIQGAAIIEGSSVWTYYFGSDGFIKKFTVQMKSEETNCYVKLEGTKVAGSDVKLGKLDFSATQTYNVKAE